MDRRELARLGGLARAARLTPERRSEIARQGFEAMVEARFAGDRARAIDWLIKKGNWSQDPCPWNGRFPDPGPMPGSGSGSQPEEEPRC